MMEQAGQWIGGIVICIGAFFYVVGAFGLVRMPDLFTRLHAASVLDTAGAGLLILGMILTAGFSLVSVKLLIILGVVVFTTPVATHALAQAALHDGVEPVLASKKVLGEPARAEDRREVPPAAPEAEKAQKRKQGAARTRRGDAARSKGKAKPSKR